MYAEQRRYAQMQRLLTGAIGTGLYRRIALSGAGEGEVGLLSYLALYVPSDYDYQPMVQEGAPTKKRAVQQLRRLRLPIERRAAHLAQDSYEDRRMWAIAVQQVQHLCLPIVFVTWTHTRSGSAAKKTLWHPGLVEPQWSLDYLKRGVLGES